MNAEVNSLHLLSNLNGCPSVAIAKSEIQTFFKKVFDAEEFLWYSYENGVLKKDETVKFFLSPEDVIALFRSQSDVAYTKGRFYVSLNNVGVIAFYSENTTFSDVKEVLLPIQGIIVRFMSELIMKAKKQDKSNLNNFHLFESFMQSTELGVQIADEAGNIVYMNAEARKRLGFHNANLSDVHVSDFEPSFKAAANWRAHVDYLRNTDSVTATTYHYPSSDGTPVPIEVQAFYRESLGKGFVFALTRDISKRMEVQAEVDLKENMLKAIAESSKELLYNFDFFDALNKVLPIIGKAVNVDRTYLFLANTLESGELVVSQKSEWNSGSSAPQIDNPELQNVPVEVFEDFMELMYRKESFQGIISKMPSYSTLRHVLEPQNIISIIIIPVFVDDVFYGFIGYDDCQNERYWSEAEVALLETLSSIISIAVSRDNFLNEIEALAELPLQNPSPVLRMDLSGIILQQNKSAEQITLQKIYCPLIGTEDLSFDKLAKKLIHKASDKNGKLECELVVGGEVFYKLTLLIISEKNYANFYFSNITNLKLIQRELESAKNIAENANQAKEMFLASMSHEIRTPLNAIIGFSRHLLKGELVEYQQKYIQDILLSGKHLQSLVENVLDFSMINVGKFLLHESPFDYAQMLRFVESLSRSMAEQKQLEFEFSGIPSEALFVIGDEVRIRQIFLNVLSNAIKFTEKGKVECVIEMNKNTAQRIQFKTVISDTGVGIEQSFITKIFENFSRAKASERLSQPGSGLGMSITKKIIDEMGGEILIQSDVNKGTKVVFNYELTLSDSPQNGVEDITISKRIEDSSLSLLVAEDNPINQSVIKTVLAHYKINSKVVNNGQEVLEQLQNKENYDCILMDIQMPIMNGLDATKIIRDEMNLTIPIIGLSANAYADHIDKCLEAGMNSYIVKPFDENKLLDAIFKCAGSSVKEFAPKTRASQGTLEAVWVDLSYIEELTRGDTEKKQELVHDFLSWTTEAIEQLESALLENNTDLFRKTHHSLAPNLVMFGLHDLNAKLTDLNEKVKQSEGTIAIYHTNFLKIKTGIEIAIDLLRVKSL